MEKREEGERNGGEMLYFEEYEYIFRTKNMKNVEKQEEEKAILRKRAMMIAMTWKI